MKNIKSEHRKTFFLLRPIRRLAHHLHTRFPLLRRHSIQFSILGVLSLGIMTLAFITLSPLFVRHSYNLGSAGGLLSPTNGFLAAELKYDALQKTFTFNADKSVATADSIKNNTTQIGATAHQDASKGLVVSDPVNKIDFKLTPTYDLLPGKQDGNRIVYPLRDGTGWAVYTMHATGVKEDVLLTHTNSNTKTYDYNLGLGSGLIAKIEADGGIGVYGNTIFSGSVSTGTEADAALLQKARQNAKKDTFLFSIPKPIILDSTNKPSGASATYSLEGTTLKIKVTGLQAAHYPLSIDPSIYVVTAQQFMQGNNETNINFDVADKLIQKSPTTGARFDTWKSTTSLPGSIWGAGTAAAGGYIYTAGGTALNNQTIFSTQGTNTYVVPTGVTSITTKMWGGGGGGGAGGTLAAGGAGAGSGYVTSTLAVTPGETLAVYVGGGGSPGSVTTAGGGGGGGGYSSLYRSATPLSIVAGGGGGGGGRTATGNTGGAGGAGGGVSGSGGVASGVASGGGGATASTGGNASSGGLNGGSAGSSLTGGGGGDGRTAAGADGTGATGGLASGGGGGAIISTTTSGGGGGGAGYFGGAGGSGSTTSSGAGGGGGGSSFTAVGATSVTNTLGSGVNPGNAADVSRNNAGTGGTAGAINSGGIAGSDGIVMITYGSAGSSASQTVNWAKFNTTTGTVDSTNPGNGTCSGWCTSSLYDLPAARSNFSMVAYNGFLYAMGGTDSAGARQSTVYIAKIGANGEPQLWHPSDPNKANWVYWYQDTGLSSVRSDMSAVAYNNRMYLIGGRSTSTPVSSVEIANINPTGTLGSWAASTALSANVYGHSVQVYNDRLYVLGGAATVGGAPNSVVQYNKINSDGTLNTWTSTTSFTTGRMANGGNLSVVWGAYIYISGGCTAVNASGYCTVVASDSQVASINADGSVDTWNNIGGVSNQRMGFGMIAWSNNIYEIGGCSAQNTTTGDCNAAMLSNIKYGSINQDGDASTVAQSVASGTAPCSGTTPTGCNLPGTASVGNMLSSAVITNGYLYVIGGCTNNTCSTTTGKVAYAAISSTGTMTKPATCPTGAYTGGTWCVDSTNIVTGGIGASSPVVFGGRIYLVGGLNGTANTNSIKRTTINNDGSITAWTSQTMTGLGASSVSYLYAYARANPSSAGTNPGNLYIFGGCANSSAAGCTAYSQGVYKCNILVSGAISACSTAGQLQIGIIPGDSAAGLGIMSGTVYANYIYLVGGVSPNLVDLPTVRYAKFDNNNNVVASTGSTWVESANKMVVGRRRAAAFGYNGYIYAVGGYDGSSGSVLADIEFIKVNVSDGSLGTAGNGFHVSSVKINQRWGLTVPISNSFAYVIGGCTAGASPGSCTARTDVIQTFQVYNNDNGAPAGYTTPANSTWPTSPYRIGASSAILNGYIYNVAGCTSTTDCTTAVSDVSYAPIDVNGTIGTWASATNGLPAVRTWGKLEVAGGSLYYVGGQSSTSTDIRAEVYYATPVSGNITSAWGTASNGLPGGRSHFGSTVWNNRLYVVGGLGSNTGCTGGSCNTVYVSPQLNSGGNITSAWSTASTSFNIPRSGTTTVAYANNLYLFGGFDGTNYLSDSQYSQINTTTGQAGAWTYSASLPGPISQADGFAANGYVYLVGGRSTATTCDPVSLVASISANTTIASGNNPTGIGEWYETNQRYSGARYGASTVYNDGKMYVIGGGCGSTLTYVGPPNGTPVIQQTPVLSQPQVAKYSIMIDTDSDVFPTSWLLNGVDNSIGAKWQLKYRSMTNPLVTDPAKMCISPAMTTWGQETNFGSVTLGLPGTYTPLSGSGVNTNCARFYYFNVSVDSSQAFGYPDDVSRGPTITDLTLQFTADPSKRLMHGRTFTGGLQQPVDTPYYTN